VIVQAEVKNETVTYDNPIVPMRIFRYKRHRELFIDWHYHKEIECLVLLRGRLDVYVEDEFYELNEGDVLLIGASQLHRDRSYKDGALRYIVFQFDIQQFFDPSTMPYMKMFSESRIPLSRLNYIFQENEEAKRAVVQCVLDIYEEAKGKKDGYEIAVSMLIRKLVLTLLRSDNRKLLQKTDDANLSRLKPVLDYIDRHIDGKIHVEEACKIANISYYYFVKLFKKALGMSFVDYVNYKKIKRAERILLTQDVSVAQVGEAIGMPSMAHFYKIFRKYNQCSPNEYRKKMLEWQR
jgi:YesN/AraC family two-component response regulator